MARAAEAACGLSRIYFVPAAQPWHKSGPSAAYADRYAMVALALQRFPRWLPLDVRPHAGADAATYSVDQVRHIRRLHPRDRIFFIVGADAFATLPSWKQPQALLSLCDTIVLARAGFSLDDMLAALPPRCRVGARPAPAPRLHPPIKIVNLAGGSRLYWLARFHDPISSTQTRQWLAGSAATGPSPLPAPVVAYARRAQLYAHA